MALTVLYLTTGLLTLIAELLGEGQKAPKESPSWSASRDLPVSAPVYECVSNCEIVLDEVFGVSSVCVHSKGT